MSKVILIGANHAGTAAANTILDNYPDTQLEIFDGNNNISYLGCGTALWIGRQIDRPDGLFYCTKDILEGKGAAVHMETQVERVDYDTKTVYAVNKDGKPVQSTYDKLILATGALPITPKIPGMDLENVEYMKLFQDGQKINAIIEQEGIQNVAVIGAGYIGVEIAEAMRRRNKNAMLFDMAETCLSGYFDDWFTADMNKVLQDCGVEQHYLESVKEIRGKGKAEILVTDKGEYPVDLVILAIGFRPNTALGAGKIQTLKSAYQVNLHQQTNLPDVYAIGDCATVYNNATQNEGYIALATNAVRSGVIAGHNVCGTPLESVGVQGSNGISIAGYKMVSTGLNLKAARAAGFNAVSTQYEDLQKPSFMTEDNQKVKLRIVYDKDTRRVLGAQLASYQDISMCIHMFSLAIEEKVTIDKLKLLDIFFMPHFNQPYNYITMAALCAE